ncbi:MAG: hypothetical protein KBC78_02995 [Candidatus Pacebacteria bacterium]|nr:hypothetical protein [Candidatus Paceibacterota bacterium]
MIKIILVVFFVIFSTGAVASQSNQNLESVVSQEDLKKLIDRVYKTSANKFLSMRFDGPQGRGFRIVFNHKGKKYTVDHDWHTEGIQVWVRKSKDEQNPDVFGDKQMTGVVDYGSDGGHKYLSLEESVGDEHQLYWQEEYNQMIVGLTRTLEKK